MSIARPNASLRLRQARADHFEAMRPSRQHQTWNQRFAPPNDPLASLMLPGANPTPNAPPPFSHALLPPPSLIGPPPPLNHLPPNFPLATSDPAEDWNQFYPHPANPALPAPVPVSSFMDRGGHQHRRDQNFRQQQHGSIHAAYQQTQVPGFHAGASFSPHHNRNANNVDARASTPRAPAQNVANPRNMTLRQITPVRDALDSLGEESLAISRLAMFVTDSRTSLPTGQRRKAILDFAGFLPSKRVSIDILCALNKQDLDRLAWAFATSRTGRKLDLAARIADSLKAPLRWRTPSGRRVDPSQNNRRSNSFVDSPSSAQGAVFSQQHQQSSVPPSNHVRAPPSTMAVNGGRSNMPSLPTINSFDPYNRRPQRGLSAVPKASGLAGRPLRKRRDNLPVLANEEFLFAENPFNIPLKPPLGNPRYDVFSSSRLTSGHNEPTLRFLTPSSSDLTHFHGKGDIQVHLRCLLMEPGKEPRKWKQFWPFPVSSKVNGTGVTLTQAQRYTNGKLAGIDKATNITPYLRSKNKGAQNVVVLRRQTSSAATADGNFVVFAQQVLVQSSATMEQIVKDHSAEFWRQERRQRVAKGMPANALDFDVALAGVVESLSSSDDIAMESMKVSLRCPLSLVHITTPVKGKNCAHIQCFDLSSFLDYARRSSKFLCPVCNKNNAHPSSLIICPYLTDALSRFKGADDVDVSSDGTMVAVETRRKGVASDTDDEDEESGHEKKNKSGAKGSTTGPGRGKPVPVIVDLCSDSEPENEALTTGSTSRPANNGLVTDALTNSGNENNDWNGGPLEQADDASQEVTFETTFRADEQYFPWMDQSEHDSSTENTPASSTPRESTPTTSMPANGTGQYGHLDNIFPSANHTNQVWSGEVISIDSD